MGEPENKLPAEVVRTKRLEIVDDEGNVRAVLGTDEAGVTSVSVFDQSERLRASLHASEVPEQMNGLGIFDANRGLQIAMGAYAISEKGSRLFFNDTNGKYRGGFGVYEDGQAGLSFSAAKKDRHIKMAALSDGNLHIMLTESGTPSVALGLAESENSELSPDLSLFGKVTIPSL
jgi:hypothetical protein